MLYTRHGEYSPIVFAADIRLADQAARRQGWRPHGRTGWMKPDGIVVQFVCFGEQLAYPQACHDLPCGRAVAQVKRFEHPSVKIGFQALRQSG
jgi:hypothetical protein